MKLVIIILSVLFQTGAFAQQYAREFIQRGIHAVDYQRLLGQNCYDDLKHFYDSGRLLKSETFIQESYPITKLPTYDDQLERVNKHVTHTPDGYYTFYHYTNVTKLAEIFHPDEPDRDSVDPRSAYNEIMSFIKRPNRSPFFMPSANRINTGYLYISSCPTCSSGYGNIQLSFTFPPETRVINIRRDYRWDTAKNEVAAKYPEVFGECQFDKMGLLVLEDSGIDIISYDLPWYQLTNFNKVLNSDVLVFSNANYSDAEKASASRVKERTYSLNKVALREDPFIPENDTVVTVEPVKVVEAIEILEASWISKNDSLQNARNLCNGKKTCGYLVHERFLPGVQYRSRSRHPFTIIWKCSREGQVLQRTIPEEARGQSLDINC